MNYHWAQSSLLESTESSIATVVRLLSAFIDT